MKSRQEEESPYKWILQIHNLTSLPNCIVHIKFETVLHDSTYNNAINKIPNHYVNIDPGKDYKEKKNSKAKLQKHAHVIIYIYTAIIMKFGQRTGTEPPKWLLGRLVYDSSIGFKRFSKTERVSCK